MSFDLQNEAKNNDIQTINNIHNDINDIQTTDVVNNDASLMETNNNMITAGGDVVATTKPYIEIPKKIFSGGVNMAKNTYNCALGRDGNKCFYSGMSTSILVIIILLIIYLIYRWNKNRGSSSYY